MDDKRDLLIAIVVLIILVLLFSVQTMVADNSQHDKDGVAIGSSGTDVSSDSGDLVVLGAGDVSVDMGLESNKSPQTGY